MTRQKTFKQSVRRRMGKTGESYTAARRHILGATPAVPQQIDETAYVVSDEAMRGATGRGWQEWFAMLDAWGGTTHSHTEIARWLVQEHSLPGWWAQSVTVGYERARGKRAKHEMAGGFSVGVSRTIAASADQVFDAFLDDHRRRLWLPGTELPVRTANRARTARFDWTADGSRIVLGLTDRGGRTQVSIQHEKLADAAAAEQAKAFWRAALDRLKELLED